MDPTRDNPIIRFTTFWWGIGTFFIFALLFAVIWLFARSEPATLEDAAAKARYETKAKIDAAQTASLTPEAIAAATATVGKQLAASKPVAVEKPAQVVPGSETAKKLAAAPAVDTSAIDAPAAADAPLDPAVMAAGKVSYMLCGACHGQNGEGGPVAPPLAGSEWVTGPVSNLIRIQLRGLVGPIIGGRQGIQHAGWHGRAELSDRRADRRGAHLRPQQFRQQGVRREARAGRRAAQ